MIKPVIDFTSTWVQSLFIGGEGDWRLFGDHMVTGIFLVLCNTEILVSDRFRCQPGAFFGTVWKLRVMIVYKMVLPSVRRERNDLIKKENCPANQSIAQEP